MRLLTIRSIPSPTRKAERAPSVELCFRALRVSLAAACALTASGAADAQVRAAPAFYPFYPYNQQYHNGDWVARCRNPALF